MTTLFIADLHLEDARPAATETFLRFLREDARGADALYILGDLFEAWVGDDDPSETGQRVAESLSQLATRGTAIALQHGNRDFLIGRDYARRCAMQLLPDPAVIVLAGTPTLISHGDALCTDDVAYMQFRAMTRQPQWKAQFLAQPLAARLAFAQQARAASKARYGELQSAGTSETITDVNAAAVRGLLVRHGIHQLIHGHTHRPAIHEESDHTRSVLGDWYGVPHLLRADAAEQRLIALH